MGNIWNCSKIYKKSDEGTLRRSLFENTGGSFPELITRGDIKLFLPPIGGLTVYCFGDPAKMSDPNVRLALRVHDECNGSDVFGSDICTCRPYLIFGVEEAVKEAQQGGSGVVIYFRKEGRALGEVTKYLVYNASKCLNASIVFEQVMLIIVTKGKRGTDRKMPTSPNTKLMLMPVCRCERVFSKDREYCRSKGKI